MNWLILLAIATFFDSIRIFVDNYTSDVYFKGTGAVSQKLFYGYAFAIIGIIILIVSGFNIFQVDLLNVGLLFLAGFLSGIAGVPYYRALEIDDTTNIGIFLQLSPVFYLILGWLFLGETISFVQLLAFVIIIAAPLLILFSSRKRSRKTRLYAIILAVIYVLIVVVGNLLFVKANTESISFVSEVGILLFGRGIANLLVVYTRPKWRKRFLNILKQSKKKLLRPLIANTIISLIKDFTWRGALIAAPAVALASAASDSAEPIVIFFLGIVLTLIWPKFGREKLNRKSVLVHLAATILVVAGVILLQF